jgi:hypothetical protein
MQSNNNNGITIITSAILVAAFFMPWLQFIVGVSGWDIVFGIMSGEIGFTFRYALIAIPVAGALILYGAALNNGNYPVPKGLLFKIPLLTLILVIIVLITKSPAELRDADFLELSKLFGIGFWLTLVGSIILFFGNSKSTTKEVSSGTEPIAPDSQKKSDNPTY